MLAPLSPGVNPMLDSRRRRRPKANPELGKHPVFPGYEWEAERGGKPLKIFTAGRLLQVRCDGRQLGNTITTVSPEL